MHGLGPRLGDVDAKAHGLSLNRLGVAQEGDLCQATCSKLLCCLEDPSICGFWQHYPLGLHSHTCILRSLALHHLSLPKLCVAMKWRCSWLPIKMPGRSALWKHSALCRALCDTWTDYALFAEDVTRTASSVTSYWGISGGINSETDRRQSTKVHPLQADAVDGVHKHLGRHDKVALCLQRCYELVAIYVLGKHFLSQQQHKPSWALFNDVYQERSHAVSCPKTRCGHHGCCKALRH